MPLRKRKAEDDPDAESQLLVKKRSIREPSVEFHMRTRRGSRQGLSHSSGTESVEPTPNPTPVGSRRGSTQADSSDSSNNSKKRKLKSIGGPSESDDDFDIQAFMQKVQRSRGSIQTSASESESNNENTSKESKCYALENTLASQSPSTSHLFNNMTSEKTSRHKRRKVESNTPPYVPAAMQNSLGDPSRNEEQLAISSMRPAGHSVQDLSIPPSVPPLTQSSSEDNNEQLEHNALTKELISGPSGQEHGVPAILVEAPAEHVQQASGGTIDPITTADQNGASSPSLSPPPSAEETDRVQPTVSRSVSVLGRRRRGRQAVPRNNPNIEAYYIRIRELKQAFRDVGKALKPALVELANRTVQELEQDPNTYKNYECYEQVKADLDKRLLERKANVQRGLRHAQKQARHEYKQAKYGIEESYKRRVEESRDDLFTHGKLDVMRTVMKYESDSEATDDERDLVKGKNVRDSQPFKRDWAPSGDIRNYDPHDRHANKVPCDLRRYDTSEREKSLHGSFYPAIDKVWDDWTVRSKMQGSLDMVLPRPHTAVDPDYEKSREQVNLDMLLLAAATTEEAELIMAQGELGKLAVAARIQRENDEADARRAKLRKKRPSDYQMEGAYIDALHSPPPRPTQPTKGAMAPPPPRRPSK